MLVPLYGFAEGDTMGVLVLAHETWTISRVMAQLRESTSLRVDGAGRWELRANERLLPPAATVGSLGLRALDRVDLRRAETP